MQEVSIFIRRLLLSQDILYHIVIPTGVLILVIFWLLRRLIYAQNENKAMQNMLISLLAKYSNRDYILSNYVYDTKFGVYKHKVDNRFFCHKCFIDDTKEMPLEWQVNGLSCPVCGSFYRNPDIPTTKIKNE